MIYHAGHGSSFEDNSVLCEFLASHGYVVFGSAFQEPSGASFNVDGKQTSARDMEFLIAYAKQLPNADWHHVGVIGHSGGAHAALITGRRPIARPTPWSAWTPRRTITAWRTRAGRK